MKKVIKCVGDLNGWQDSPFVFVLAEGIFWINEHQQDHEGYEPKYALHYKVIDRSNDGTPGVNSRRGSGFSLVGMPVRYVLDEGEVFTPEHREQDTRTNIFTGETTWGEGNLYSASLCKEDNDEEYLRACSYLNDAERRRDALPHAFHLDLVSYYRAVLAFFDRWYVGNRLDSPKMKGFEAPEEWDYSKHFTSLAAYNHFKVAYCSIKKSHEIIGASGHENIQSIIEKISELAGKNTRTIRDSAQKNGWYGSDLRKSVLMKAAEVPESILQSWTVND